MLYKVTLLGWKDDNFCAWLRSADCAHLRHDVHGTQQSRAPSVVGILIDAHYIVVGMAEASQPSDLTEQALE